jgi:hypothetical protein
VLTGSAGILPAGSAASGKKPVPTWMDVDMSLLNKETESDGQLKFDQTSGAIKYDRTKKPTVDEWREYGLAHTLKLSGIQRTNFVELQQLYERLIVSHGFDAVYSFSLEVREKERVSQPGIQHKITSFMANHLCYDYGGDSGRVEYALHNIVSVERVSDLRCDFVRRSHCKMLTTILWLCECLGREFWPGGGDPLCGIERKSPKSFVRCAQSERFETGKFIYMSTEGNSRAICVNRS